MKVEISLSCFIIFYMLILAPINYLDSHLGILYNKITVNLSYFTRTQPQRQAFYWVISNWHWLCLFIRLLKAVGFSLVANDAHIQGYSVWEWVVVLSSDLPLHSSLKTIPNPIIKTKDLYIMFYNTIWGFVYTLLKIPIALHFY